MAFNKQYSMGGNLSSSISEVTSMPTAGAYFVGWSLQFPRIAAGAPASSQVVMTVTNVTTSTTIFTSSAGNDGSYVDFNAAAGDVIRTTLSSSAAVDQTAHAIKCEVAIGSGQ